MPLLPSRATAGVRVRGKPLGWERGRPFSGPYRGGFLFRHPLLPGNLDLPHHAGAPWRQARL